MKKYLFFATALAALASCTSNDFVGEDTSSTTNQSEQAAIAFGTGVKTVTRADHYGVDAATLLNNKFIVGGFKGATATPFTDMVYDNYQVQWVANTAGTTQSNTSDWEYVGIEFAHPSTLVNDAGENHAVQSIKYWDYSADQYDFIAYSTGDAPITYIGEVANETEAAAKTRAIDASKVLVTAIDAANAATKAYELTGKAAQLEKCYIADMVTAYKADKSPVQPKFQEEIQFKFRALASKVRVAIYETIPGYSVKEVKFYEDAATVLDPGATSTVATLFTTGTNAKDNFYTEGTCKVYFPTIGSDNISKSDYNLAHVTFSPTTTGKTTTMDFGGLNYTGKEKREKTGTDFLGRTSATASYAGTTDPYYKIAMPNEEGTVLELRIDYTLESLDGSGEEIHVYGATAFVPAIYAAWKSNYAYTYIFKISDNTNGWTNKASGASNSVDPAGLYPITFDAVVLETEDRTQSTITTVATPSITTYQKGHDITKDEYAASTTAAAKDSIYVQVMEGGTLKNDLDTKGALYTVTLKEGASDPDGKLTEAEIMDALNIEESVSAGVITGRNGWKLAPATIYHSGADDPKFASIPGADGNVIPVDDNTASRFYAAAGTTYAYVYTISTGTPKDVGIPQEYNTAPGDWSNTLYFTDKNCTTAAPATFAAGIYYKKTYTDKQNAYAVKIIKIASGS